MSGRITNIVETSNYIKQVIYGQVRSGKTTYMGTMPNLIVANAEGGDISLQGSNADLFKIENFEDMHTFVEFLEAHAILRDSLAQYIGKKDSPASIELKDRLWALTSNEPRGNKIPTLYYSVGVDSLTEVQKKSMDTILAEPKRLEKHDPDKPNLEDYLKNTVQIRKLVRKLRDLPYHLCLICLIADDKEDTGEPVKRPLLTPKLAEEVMGFCDLIGCMYTKTEQVEVNGKKVTKIGHKMLIKPYGDYRAGVRLPIGREAPAVIDNPNFNKIREIILGG